MTVSRREFTGKAIGLAAIGLGGASCTQAQANEFINLLNTVVVAIQAAEPVIAILAPAPFNLLLPVIQGFLNLADKAADETANELATKDPIATMVKNILGYWAGVLLDPTVLAKLPTNIGNTNPQALIVAITNAVNAILTQVAADIPGASALPSPTNAILTVNIPAATNLAAVVKTKHFRIDAIGRTRLAEIRVKTQRIKVDLGGTW